MPTVKLEPVRDVKKYEKYLMKDRESELHHEEPEGMNEEMHKVIQDEHSRLKNKMVKHEAFTIVQSWSHEESKMFDAGKYNQMGRELAEKFAPGHLAWVTTHTDKKHIHNHITICSVHSVTGKALSRSFKDIERLHEVNNGIAQANGLTLNLPRVKDPHAKLPDKVRQMVARGKQSWKFDLAQKVDFARASSTNFDEFTAQMKMLGVDVNVQNRNVSYFYGTHTKATRGKSLGTNFDKSGLMKAFKENDEKFARNPKLREQFQSDIRAAFDSKGRSLGTPSDLLLESASHRDLSRKDYSKFTKIDRNGSRHDLPAIFNERGGLLYNEMKKARETSLFDYCKSNNIQTKKNAKGETVLAGKEFVVLQDKEWTNTKNRTKGTIIDFVAIHTETNYLRAIAKINNNPRLLMLEPFMSETKTLKKSFVFPKISKAEPEAAKKVFKGFMLAHGYSQKNSGSLLKSERVFVSKNNNIWLMNEDKTKAVEFYEEKNGKWSHRAHGTEAGAFEKKQGRSQKCIVSTDPFAALLDAVNGKSKSHPKDHKIVLFSEQGKKDIVELFALNPQIKELELVKSSNLLNHFFEANLFNDLKKAFEPFDIKIKEVSAHERSKDKSKGHDFDI